MQVLAIKYINYSYNKDKTISRNSDMKEIQVCKNKVCTMVNLKYMSIRAAELENMY